MKIKLKKNISYKKEFPPSLTVKVYNLLRNWCYTENYICLEQSWKVQIKPN